MIRESGGWCKDANQAPHNRSWQAKGRIMLPWGGLRRVRGLGRVGGIVGHLHITFLKGTGSEIAMGKLGTMYILAGDRPKQQHDRTAAEDQLYPKLETSVE